MEKKKDWIDPQNWEYLGLVWLCLCTPALRNHKVAWTLPLHGGSLRGSEFLCLNILEGQQNLQICRVFIVFKVRNGWVRTSTISRCTRCFSNSIAETEVTMEPNSQLQHEAALEQWDGKWGRVFASEGGQQSSPSMHSSNQCRIQGGLDARASMQQPPCSCVKQAKRLNRWTAYQFKRLYKNNISLVLCVLLPWEPIG